MNDNPLGQVRCHECGTHRLVALGPLTSDLYCEYDASHVIEVSYADPNLADATKGVA